MKKVALIVLLALASIGARAPQDQVEALILETERHFFVSHELVNLHHFLYEWARLDGPVRGPKLVLPEKKSLANLSEAERQTWDAALAIYTERALDKDLLFDWGMQGIRNRLLTDGLEGKGESDQERALLDALRAARPVYEAHWWPKHDEKNRAWTADAAALLERHGDSIMQRLALAFSGTWPDRRIRVDVTAHANWAGAYTSWEPTHVTISSMRREHQGNGALEIVLHESGHHDGLMKPLGAALTGAFSCHGVEAPRNLWHVILFDTVSQEVARALKSDGVEKYVPIGERLGVYGREPWKTYFPAVVKHWRPYLADERELGPALAGLAQALKDVKSRR